MDQRALPSRTQSARRFAAGTFAAVACVAWMAAGVGVLDHYAGATASGGRLLVRGGIGAVVFTLAALLAAPPVRGERVRLAVVAFGVWPFATFGMFLAWRIGISAEQLAACEAGDAESCRILAERKDKRGKPDEAIPLFQAGCELGDGRACTTLALRATDPSEAGRYFAAGCEAGIALACTRRAEQVTEPAEHAALLDRACALGDASACERARLDRGAE